MNDLYKDQTYVNSLLVTLAENINEMEMWSVVHEDKGSYQIARMKDNFNEIKKMALESK